LTFLGRIDHQIKLRGFRIELGEIEAVLRSQPQVRQAVALVRQDLPGGPGLVAYATPSGAELSLDELMAVLRRQLPEYMVPAILVPLDELPLTANGKLDRKALPIPSGEPVGESEAPPATPLEEIIAGLYAEVLGVDRVSPRGHFFALGGHSLLAARLVSRLRQVCQVEISLRQLFEAPTVAGLATTVAALRRSGTAPPAPPPSRVPRQATMPLSFAQERLWFLDQLEPGTAAYNLPLAVRLRGNLNVAALRASLEAVVQRHEILRCRFRLHAGQPTVDLAGDGSADWAWVDLRTLTKERHEPALQGLLESHVARPFDLTTGPLMRALLVSLGEVHVFAVTMHHISTDGWSMGILVRELAANYTAAVTSDQADGPRSGLPALPIQYADYAVWQRRWLQGESRDAHLAWWRQHLSGDLPVLDLPLDRPRPQIQSFRGERVGQRLAPEPSTALEALGHRLQATLFMTLLAAYQLLLGRWSGQRDLLVGIPSAGRTRRETEDLIGFFINTLALRANLGGVPSAEHTSEGSAEPSLTFAELVAQTRATALDAFAHQEVPFEQIVADLDPHRDPSRTPLFQAFFNLLNLEQRVIELPQLMLEEMPLAEPPSKFDLTLYAAQASDGLRLELVYNADLFDRRRMEAFLDAYVGLVEQVVTDPDRPIDEYSLRTGAAADGLPTAERAQASRPLLADDAASLPALVATTAEAQASEPAVSDGTVHWSYGELWQRSGEVASQLAAGGLGRADRVAIYGERSAEWAAAVLGVSRIGATFLLLDPAYPTARLADHVHQAKPRGWLQLAEPPAELADLARRSCGDRQWHGPPAVDATPRSTPLPALPTPNDPAYVIFTSGSSGRPKGVLGSHRPVAAFLAWYRERFDLGKEDRFAALSGLGHDPLQRDLWTPLMLGAELRIPSPDLLTEPVELWRWLRREAISVLHLTPSLARFLLDSAPAGDYLPAVRLVLFGGEPLTYALVARFRERAPRATCVNVYGATETPQVMAFHIVEGNEAGRRDAGRVPLGHGRDSVDLVVTDPRGRVCAVGELGEIGVRSADLARGYLGDEPLTRERFVADPWTGNAHCIYRTGDLGRYLPGGAVEFVGRADQQVKIRGFRVEPAEVEAALATHRAVAEVTVIGRAEAAGDTRLVAYLAAREGHVAPDDTGLRAFLASRLPAPMVPSHFVTLDSLPRLPNRKIDRRALPEPQAHAAGQTYVAPRTRTEEQLAAVWSQVLGIERVGVHDDFFLLGGHSLIATRLAQRVRQTFGVELPLRRLFQSPTLVALAEWIDLAHRERQASAVELPTILPDRDHRHEPFPMTDVQQAYWIGRSAALELGDVATHSYLELEYPQLDCERFAAAWQRLIDRHAMLRAVMLPDGRQRVLEDLPPYEIATLDLRHRSPDEIAGALQAVRDELSHQVLDPERWPLFELRFTRLEDRVILHISRDALLYDAWSLVLLLRELVQLYREPSTPLEPLTLTFRDYVLAEEDLRQTDLYNRSVEYWQTRLDNLPPAPELPLAVDTASLRNPGFERRQGRLDLAGWQAIRQRAQLRGLSTSAVLLAAYGEVLASWSKSPRFTLNLTLFNRLPFHPQVDQLVGDFTSLTLLEIEVQPGESLEGRAQRLQARLWEDLDHRYVGGVWVMRQLARRQKDGLRARMPMVFTSTLGLRQEAVQGAQELAGRVAYNITQTPQVWLDHQVTETPEGLLFNWDSIAGLFPEGLVDGMFEAYQALLVDLAAGDGAWQAGDRCHTPAADLMLYDGVNSTLAPARVSPPPEGLLHQPFLGQVVRRTDAIAVVDDDLYLSYGALHRQACHLAHALRQLGARPNRLIAVVMDKGWEQVAAVLAILEAGAAYLPIDAELPAERRDVLLRQGEAEVVLTQPRWRHRLDWPSGVQVLSVDGEAPTEPPELGSNPATPTDLAYVIFTSGSTGMPKGVMIDHRGALNTCLDVNRRFAVGAEDRVLALSALNFDLSVYDIFGLLAAGGTIVLPAADRRRDPAHWTEQVRRHGVTLWNSVPALMEMLVEYSSLGVAGGITPLRLVLLSGDWIPVTLPQRLRALHAKADSLELISLGGATEASIWSILFPIGEVEPGWSSIPYGQPMDLQTFHVLDPALRPRPRWVPGELYIGGIGVAKGYWKDP
ncbi:MAG: amino acid adenylation domain-containing protein, partial [Acidobacteriota bacterium]